MTFAGELAEFFSVFPGPIAVFLLAMSPIGEVRMSIPIAKLAYGMGWAEAFTWSLLGNLAVIPLATWLYPVLERGLRRWDRADRFFERMYEKTRKRHSEKIERLEEFAVFGFIATPVPGTGAWSGVLAAHVFGLPLRKTWRFYYAGIVTACLLTVILVELGVWGFNRV